MFYISRESHLAWFKIAHQAGIGRDAVRLSRPTAQRTPGSRRLPAAFAADRARRAAGHDRRHGRYDQCRDDRPARATAPDRRDAADSGSTSMPLGAGRSSPPTGIAARSPASSRPIRSRSTRINGSRPRWAAACSFTPAQPRVLRRSMSDRLHALAHADRIDPYLTSVQWSRRFLGLRLFLSLAAAGWTGYATHIERAGRSLRWCASVSRRGAGGPWIDSQLAVLCVLPPAGYPPIRDIVKRVLASGGRGWRWRRPRGARSCASASRTGKPRPPMSRSWSPRSMLRLEGQQAPEQRLDRGHRAEVVGRDLGLRVFRSNSP